MKKSNIKYLAAAILLMGIFSNAYAEEKQNELSAFMYINDPIEPTGQDPTVTMYASYGRYLTEQLAITGSITTTASGGFSMGGIGFGGKYYFSAGRKGDVVPFVLAELQFGAGGDNTTDIYYTNIAAGGGASFFITETASIDGRLVYQAGSTTATTYTAFGTFDSTYDSSSMLLTIGITQRF